MNQDQIQDAIEDVKTWIGRSPASIDERYYERKAGEAFDSLVEEIERLKGESQKNFMAFMQEAMISGVKCEFRDQKIQSLQSQIATLTAERDEAIRIKNEILQDAKREITGLRDGVEKDLAELAALKSAPGMEEVDALVAKEDSLSAKMSAGHYLLFINACDLARRSTASREEVVGLLDHILSCIITVKQENTPEWMEWIVEEVNKVNEAIGDPDRVALSLGNIVIVKGCPEIVEGNHA